MSKPTAMGVSCGVGSMLIGARAAGFKVIGNIEHRNINLTGTFEHNFPHAFLVKSLLEIQDLLENWDGSQEEIENVDLVMGHPACGSFSNLNTTGVVKKNNPEEILEFIEIVSEIKPRFFAMDNLAKSLTGASIELWIEAFPDYDIFPEFVSNYHYGNTQKGRKRLFIIGARKEEGFVFQPGEFFHEKVVRDVIGDLPTNESIYEINHNLKDKDALVKSWTAHRLGLREYDLELVPLWEFQEFLRDYPNGKLFMCTNLSGRTMKRPGFRKINIDGPAPVVVGGSGADNFYRHDNMMPFTIRERARIQGVPDNFIFLPLDYMENPAYTKVYKQGGKFIPVEFTTYLSKLIMAHIKGRKLRAITGRRHHTSEYVDEAKFIFCENKGYSQQAKACENCWLKHECELEVKK